MNFSDFVGQKEIIAGLRNSIRDNRVGHAYIFSGPKGIGKRTLAQILTSRLICQNSDNEESCGQCAACRMFDNSSNPDVQVICQENESIGVEEIRKLQGDMMIKPVYSAAKIYLIIDAEKMTIQAQNCLLKVLEEPHRYAVFILTTSNYESLLGTIRSRATKYSFKKNTPSEVEAYLKKRFEGINKGLDFVVSYSDGVIGTALELLDSEDFSAMREQVIRMIIRLNKAELIDIFEIYDFFEINKNRVETVLDIMLLLYRDFIIVKTAGKENVLINSDKKDIILDNVSNFSMDQLSRGIEIIENTRKNIKQNANYQLSIEVMLMKLQEDTIHGKGGWSKV